MPSAHKVQLRVLLTLLRDRRIDSTEFYLRVAQVVAEAVKCSRAAVWLFRNECDGYAMTCIGVYDRARGKIQTIPDIRSTQAMHFIEAMAKTGYIVVDDATNHPTTRLLFNEEPKRVSVRSLAAAAFSLNGRLYGAFSCAQLDKSKKWTQSEILLLKRLGAHASLVMGEADTWHRSQEGDRSAPQLVGHQRSA